MAFGLSPLETEKACEFSDLKAMLAQELKPHLFSAWNQGGRDDTGDGVCMGMCLDWLRRILTGKASQRFKHPVSAVYAHGREPEAKEASRFGKVIKTHALYQEVQGQHVTKAMMNWDQKQHPLVLHGMKTLHPSLLTGQTYDGMMNKIASLPDAERDRVVAGLQDLIKDVLARDTELERIKLQTQIFADFSGRWKRDVTKTRQSTVSPGGFFTIPVPFMTEQVERTHNFSSIRVTRSGPEVSATGSGPLAVGDFLEYVEGQIDNMKSGNAAVLSVQKFIGGGHDVAFHLPAQGDFTYYFDPNIGEFRFSASKKKYLGLLLWGSWLALFAKRGYNSASWVEYAPA